MNLVTLLELIHEQVSLQAFWAQVILIFGLFLYGYTILGTLAPSQSTLRKGLFAFPTALAVFSLVAFLLILTGIPYRPVVVIITCLLALILIRGAGLLLLPDQERKRMLKGADLITKQALIVYALAFAAALIACCGLLRVAVSNDSMFNYSFYPRMIVHFGGLRPNFNTFLTDVGQGAAMINTLPFLFGFQETFGIQHMLNFSFLGIFFASVYSLLPARSRLQRTLFASLGTLLLASCLPYLLLSKWILSNDYFGVWMFLCILLSVENGGGEDGKERYSEQILLSILLCALSIIRIEGGVYALLLILCISTLKYENGRLACGMLLPVMLLQGLYAFRIFVAMKIIAPYRFLTEEKALLILSLMAAGFVFLSCVRERLFLKLQKHTGILIIVGMIGVNLLLCASDPGMYLENLRAFAENIAHKGGWGFFPATILVLYALSLNRSFRFNFLDLCGFSYLLYAFAVCFMREGGMQAYAGDSGNRVLLQAVPLVLFAALNHVADLLKEDRDG